MCVTCAVLTFTGCAQKSFSEEMTHLHFLSAKAILCVRSFLIELHIDEQIMEMSLMAKCENEMRSLADLILLTGGKMLLHPQTKKAFSARSRVKSYKRIKTLIIIT